MVLLKNGKNQTEPFLPLAKNVKRILVAGTHADDIGYQCGGWTIAWHGGSGKITPGKNKLNFDIFVYQLCSQEGVDVTVLYRSFLLYYSFKIVINCGALTLVLKKPFLTGYIGA